MKKTGFDFHITPELLGLDNIKINNVSTVSDGSIHIQVSSTPKELPCQHCQQPTAPNGSGPAAAWLFGSALVGLAGIKRKK